ncbi:MAG TPA: choice-of-anchor tandem repeat GloVer-containing protein [Chitinophagaceae bacterium]|nr:choice-of-anchor tandem repeat GloVer-containing protein [Chitinophagaceae bacterium]
MRKIISFALLLLASAGILLVSCTKQSGGTGNGGTTDTTGTTDTDTLGHSIILYGNASAGGDNDSGAIFTLRGDGTGFKIVYSFKSREGNSPGSTLCKGPNGKLYGVASGAGAYKQGTLFSFDPSSGTVNKIVDFSSTTNGIGDPFLDLTLAANGLIYGGNGYYFFSVDPATDKFTLLHKANALEGNISSCVQGKDGKLYGISYAGGRVLNTSLKDTNGIIYSYDITNNVFKRLYTFVNATGMSPVNKLCAASDGNLYGLTYEGGTNNDGVIFMFNPRTNAYTKLLDLDGTNGRNPILRNHLEEYNSKLYGIMYLGSTFAGAIFNYNTATSVDSILYTPNANPQNYVAALTGLLLTSRNIMYVNGIGITSAILRYNPANGSKKVIFQFPDAKTPVNGGLTEY